MKNYYRKTIGLITMGNSASIERGFHDTVPKDIGVVTTRIPFQLISRAALLEMLENIPGTVRLLMQARPDVIVIPSASGSYLKGNEIVNTIHQISGLPVVIPSQQYSKLLKKIDATRIMLISSFTVELSMLAEVYFDSCGITVADTIHIGNLSNIDPYFIAIDHRQVLEKVSKCDFSGVDAVIFDNPDFRFHPDILSVLEQYIKIPMFNLAQIMLFGALESIGESTDHLYIAKFLP